ncbi:MAG: anthranilate phosphoribosyltransferase [Nitrososphaera sp.]|jgi:anthranilate phosphoribosyltransferase
MIGEITNKLSNRTNLTYDEMASAMEEILAGSVTTQESIAFLNSLTEKKETDEELLAMLDKMQEHAIHIMPKRTGKIIDVCGTGGDKMSTFNISTASAFVIAASDGSVAKHGNRSVSGTSGSADVVEYFGYDLNMEPKKIEDMIEKFGIGFMFAQKFHPAMKNISEARKAIGKRTAFNLLGPLCNPANVKNQLVGVFSKEYLTRIVELLKLHGSENIMTVISEDGLDELSTTAKNHICYFHKGEVITTILNPIEVGLSKAKLEDIQVLTKEQAILAFVKVLNGSASRPMIETVALNSAAGLIVSELSNDFNDAVKKSLETIKSGKAYDLFKNFIREYGDISKIEEIEKR